MSHTSVRLIESGAGDRDRRQREERQHELQSRRLQYIRNLLLGDDEVRNDDAVAEADGQEESGHPEHRSPEVVHLRLVFRRLGCRVVAFDDL